MSQETPSVEHEFRPEDVDEARTEMLVDRLVNPATRDAALEEQAEMYRRDANVEVAKEVGRRVAERADRADIDFLTGLRNRQALEQDFMVEARRAERRQETLAVVMFDLKDFKDINERHGHDVGDLVIQGVSRVMESALYRPGDGAYRYGGDEFAVLLPGIDSGDHASAVVDRMLDKFPHNPSTRKPVEINPESVVLYKPEPGSHANNMKQARGVVKLAWENLKKPVTEDPEA